MSLPLKYDLNLSKEYVPEGKKNRPGDKSTPAFITVHNTGNTAKGADADAHSRLVRNKGYYEIDGKKKWVSWHFTVDDGEVIKQLPINEVGYHAGKGNTQSVAIEQCMNQGIDVAKVDERLCQLIAQLRIALSLERRHVVPHKHWTGKNCPVLLLKKWETILNRVDEIVKEKPTIDEDLISDGEKEFFAREEIPLERKEFLESFDTEHLLKIQA